MLLDPECLSGRSRYRGLVPGSPGRRRCSIIVALKYPRVYYTYAMSARTGSRSATVITAEQFAEFLPPAAEEVECGNTLERVWELPLPTDDLSIRVFSTIEGETSRGYGEDAIRTVVWSAKAGGPIGGETKTLRIDTWRKNLQAKLESAYANWRKFDHGTCPECGEGVLCEREGKYGDFLACSTWEGGRGCKFTRNLD